MKDNLTAASPPHDVLEARPLHQLMLALHRPVDWAWPRLALAAFALPLLAGLSWGLAGGNGGLGALAGLLLALFMAADGALFWSLPRRGLSFGPWRSHLFVLALPRLAGGLLLALLLPVLGAEAALALLLAGQLLGTALLLWGALVEPFRLQLTELELSLPQWPASASPLRLLHVSDLHLERCTRREERLLRLAVEARPDLIVLTGDYLNLSFVEDGRAQADLGRLLAGLWAPLGVFATLGSPPVDDRARMPALFHDLPLRLLRNEKLLLELGEGRALTLVGLDCSHDLPFDAGMLGHLAADRLASHPALLLYHSPELMLEASRLGLDLYLCGHTHGGQVRLPGYGAVITSSRLGKQFEMGHYRRGRTHLYVSRGVGMEGMSAPRLRFLCPPEITLVTLRGGEAGAATAGTPGRKEARNVAT